jgi:O-antigen/teichoic acid export membrane protein
MPDEIPPAVTPGWRRVVWQRGVAAFWNGLAGALPRAALLLAGLFVANRFGPDDFARYSVALVTANLAGNLPGSVLSTVASKFVPELAGGRLERAGPGFAALLAVASGLALVVAAALWLLAPVLGRLFALEPPVDALLHVSAAMAAGAIMAGAANGLLLGSGRYRHAAEVNVLAVVVFGALLWWLSGTLGVASALVALFALYAALAVAALWRTRARMLDDLHRVDAATLRAQMRAMLGFFVPTLLAAGIVTPVVWLCTLILARGGEPLANVARFNAAMTWYSVLSFAPGVLAQVEFVRLSARKGAGELHRLRTEFLQFVLQNLALMLPIVLVAMAVAHGLMGLFGLHDDASAHALRILLIGILAASLANPAGLFLAVVDRIWVASLLNVGWAVVALALAWALRARGTEGVVLAFAIAYTLHFLVASACALRLTPRHGPAR